MLSSNYGIDEWEWNIDCWRATYRSSFVSLELRSNADGYHCLVMRQLYLLMSVVLTTVSWYQDRDKWSTTKSELCNQDTNTQLHLLPSISTILVNLQRKTLSPAFLLPLFSLFDNPLPHFRLTIPTWIWRFENIFQARYPFSCLCSYWLLGGYDREGRNLVIDRCRWLGV